MELEDNEQTTIESEPESTTEEEITELDLSAITERLDALDSRISQLEGLLTEFTARLGGYDGRFAEYDERFTRTEPAQRHWYFRRITPEVS